jgi:anti-sigma factor ChrR (cupin superfamily)
MSPVLSCAWTTDLMTDYLEGALPFHRLAGVKLHLGLCPRCRAFLASLRSLPGFMRQALFEGPDPAPGLAALGRVMARIESGEAQEPTLHPETALCESLASGSADLSTRLVLGLHLDRCATCRGAHPDHVSEVPTTEPPLPRRVLESVRPQKDWAWMRHGLKGAKAAEIFTDPQSGAALWLAFLPSGARFPRHSHGGAEALAVLDGWLQDGPCLAGPGDFLQMEAGSEHEPEAEGRDGCWILARVERGGMHFSGWRGLFG